MFNIIVFIEYRNNPEFDSLTTVFRASDLIEREIHEMLGVNFAGHPGLKHLLLDHDWPKDNYPLRKTCIPDRQPYPLEGEAETNG